MIETKRATIREENGHQVIVLPEGVHIEGSEVTVLHNPETGEITVRAVPERASAWEFLAFLDSLDIPREDLDAFMAERPLNVSLEPEDVLGENE